MNKNIFRVSTPPQKKCCLHLWGTGLSLAPPALVLRQKICVKKCNECVWFFFLFLVMKTCRFLKFTVPNQNCVVVSIIPSAFGFWTIRRFIATTMDRCKLAAYNDDHFYTIYSITESPRPLCTPRRRPFSFFCLYPIFNNCNHQTDVSVLHTDYHRHDCYYHYHHYYSNKINTPLLFLSNNRARLAMRNSELTSKMRRFIRCTERCLVVITRV